MGIKNLMKLISDNCPSAVKEKDISAYFGLKVAVDASMCLYQFLIAVRHGADSEVLTNESGDVTSHLMGMFYRTIRMLDVGIKPVFVFDGAAPTLKGGELDKRKERREAAEEELKAAVEAGDDEAVERFKKRTVRVTREHNEEVKTLLRLMGVPIVEAPGEAEAQCAELVKCEKVFATATEDMDALTFGSKKLLRHLTFSEARAVPIVEIDLSVVLKELGLSHEEFIDLCILCGCDYTSSIRGIGPMRALEIIKEFKSIESGIKKLDKDKYKVPDDFLYKEAHELFVRPVVADGKEIELKWSEPNEEALIDFLVKEKGFNLDRVTSGLKRLKGARGKASQQRMEGFFKVTETPQSQKEAHEVAMKRKRDEEAKKKKAQKLAGLSKGKFANSNKKAKAE